MAGTFTFKIDDKWFNDSVRKAPKLFFKHLRRGYRNVYGSSRKHHTFPGELTRKLEKKYRFVPRAMRKSVVGNSIESLNGRMEPRRTDKAVNALQFGGTWRPKRGRYLAIPIHKSLTRAGRTKKFALNRRFRNRAALETGANGKMVVIRSRSGKLILGRRNPARTKSVRKSRKRSFEGLYVLERSVKTKPVLKLDQHWRKYGNRTLPLIMNQHMSDAMEEFAKRGK